MCQSSQAKPSAVSNQAPAPAPAPAPAGLDGAKAAASSPANGRDATPSESAPKDNLIDKKEKGSEVISKKTTESSIDDAVAWARLIKKVPPPGHQQRERRRRRQRLVAGADDPCDHQGAVDRRWYAGYQLKKDLPEAKAKNYGMFAAFSRFRPAIEERDMSLIQILVGNRDTSHPIQTLEAGWQRVGHRVDEEKRSGNVGLFIFFTTNGYCKDGWGVSGYVTEENNRGYEYLTKDPRNVWRAGTFMSASHVGGPQEILTLQWHLVKDATKMKDGWYLAINGIWNGYFPLRFFELGTPDKTKTLADNATICDFYGEVFDANYDRAKDTPEDRQVRTTTDMGSGREPKEGWKKAAFISNIQRKISEPSLPDEWEAADDATFVNYADLDKKATDPAMYDITFQANSGTTAGSYAYLGGSGARRPFDKWEEWEDISGTNRRLRGPSFDALGPVCLTARAENLTDLCMIGVDGRVWLCWQNEQNDWSGFNDRSEWSRLYFGDDNTPELDIRAKLAVVARTPMNVDIFVVAKDGKVYWCSMIADEGVMPWKDISGESRFPSGAPITAVSRMPEQIDVFINAGDSRVYSSWWRSDLDESKWDVWELRGRGSGIAPFRSSVDPVVLVRDPHSLDIFMMGDNGHVYTASWIGPDGPWTLFGDIGTSAPDTSVNPPRPTSFFGNGKLAGLADGPGRMDLFAIASDQQLYTCTFTRASGWSGIGLTPTGENKYWTPLGYGTKVETTTKIFDSLSDVVAVRRQLSHDMDVFVAGFYPRTATEADSTHVYRTNFNASLNRWRTVANSNEGWDTEVGGGKSRLIVHDRGFRLGATSRNPQGLTVVSILTGGRVISAEYGRE
ncbi:hypothetical protein BKA56DRAFT_660093 [Ilyonectria sp. MPI-CAGE-AT-0026]|nr:hypothetical protein BKA56DRAFT_660093 [Ilyonectria sp. MPI-CAGE-AT-0026]